jgi:hypothetical protein
MIDTATQTAISRNVPVSNLIRAQFSSGKITLPLRGNLYTSFTHVKGVPSRDAGAYSLSKLQLIDVMVDRLVRLRSDESLSLESLTSEPTSDTQIQELAAQLAQELDRARVGSMSFTAGTVETGLYLNAVA